MESLDCANLELYIDTHYNTVCGTMEGGKEQMQNKSTDEQSATCKMDKY
jgi:hypothetical protein